MGTLKWRGLYSQSPKAHNSRKPTTLLFSYLRRRTHTGKPTRNTVWSLHCAWTCWWASENPLPRKRTISPPENETFLKFTTLALTPIQLLDLPTLILLFELRLAFLRGAPLETLPDVSYYMKPALLKLTTDRSLHLKLTGSVFNLFLLNLLVSY